MKSHYCLAWLANNICTSSGNLLASQSSERSERSCHFSWSGMNITLDGYSMPLGIWQLSWDTSLIMGKIFGILVSEMLGYHIRYGTGRTKERLDVICSVLRINVRVHLLFHRPFEGGLFSLWMFPEGSGSFSIVWTLGGCPSTTPSDIQDSLGLGGRQNFSCPQMFVKYFQSQKDNLRRQFVHV